MSFIQEIRDCPREWKLWIMYVLQKEEAKEAFCTETKMSCVAGRAQHRLLQRHAVCMSHSSLTVPWGQYAQSDKSYWNNPISAGCSWGKDRGISAVCAGEGVGHVPAGFQCSSGMGISLEPLARSPLRGCYLVQAQLTQIADPPLGQDRSW